MIEIRDPNDPLPRKFGVMPGVVVNNRDPRGIGRVRVRVPGMYEPAGPWALPHGTSAAGANSGGWFIPKVGAEVTVILARGNPDHPYYSCANWTEGNVPDEAKTNGKGDPDVRVLAFEDYAIVFDDRLGRSGLKILHRPSGDVIEHSGTLRQWSISATSSLALKAIGQIDLQAPVVTINGRTVLPTGEPI